MLTLNYQDLSDESDGEPKDGVAKKIAILEHECYERGKSIRHREVQVVKLKGKARRLKEDAAEGTKWKEKARKLKSLKKEKLAALRKAQQEAEITKKQLTQYKSGKAGEVTSALEKDLAAAKVEVQELREAKEKLTNEDKKEQMLRELKEANKKLLKDKEQRDKEADTMKMEVVRLRRELHERKWSISLRTSVSEEDDIVVGGGGRGGKEEVTSRGRTLTDTEVGRMKRTLEIVKKDKEELDLIFEAVYDVSEYSFDSNDVPHSAKKVAETLTAWKVFSGDLRTNAKLLDSIVNAIATSLKVPFNINNDNT